jgi:precorrin-8X/cobalt-precorrin-8 methylmutase
MAKAGINKRAAEKLGLEIHCFIDSPEAAETARASGSTRARAAVDIAAKKLEGPIIFAVGNAPTALIRIHELASEGALHPSVIVAVPGGFVNVVESKEMILGLGIPHIVAKGQKGGSNVAAAIINALLYDTTERGW